MCQLNNKKMCKNRNTVIRIYFRRQDEVTEVREYIIDIQKLWNKNFVSDVVSIIIDALFTIKKLF